MRANQPNAKEPTDAELELRSDSEVPGPEIQSRLEDMVKQLAQALKLRSFYPKGHTAVTPAMAEFKTMLDAALHDKGDITIGSTGEALIFEGHPFGEDNRPLRNFAKHLKVRNLSGIAFRRGVSDAELENMLEILSRDPEEFSSPESPLLHSGPLTEHIEFKQIDYGSALRHVSEDESDFSAFENQEHVWESLVTHHLLSDNEGLSAHARELITHSAGDKAALEQMAQQLVKASSGSGVDAAGGVARGLARTCKVMEDTSGAQRDRGMANIADIVSKMDPQVIACLAEEEATDDATGEDLIQEVTQRLPLEVKMRLLTALVHSQRMDKSRLSSVFRRVAGSRSRRQELLDEMRKAATQTPQAGTDQFGRVYSAVQDLVLTESEDRFVGSDYVSMLEELGEGTLDQEDSTAEGLECLDRLRGSLDHDQRLEFKTRFLIDLARLQEEPQGLTATLDDLKKTCGELCARGDQDILTEVVVQLAEDLSSESASDGEKQALLQDCLKTIALREQGQPALERLLGKGSETEAPLEAALVACGPEACGTVLSIVAKSDAATDSRQILGYLASHTSNAAEAAREILRNCPPSSTRRVMKVMSLIVAPEAVETAKWAIENGDKLTRAEALRALTSMRSPAAEEALKELFSGHDQELVSLAASYLGEARAGHAVPILLESLKNVDFFGRKLAEVRQVAAALGRIGSRAAVPYLERLLTRRFCAPNETKKELRKAVALALRNIGGDEALLVLTRNASCYNRQVREVCKWALSRPERPPRGSGRDWHDGSAADSPVQVDCAARHDEMNERAESSGGEPAGRAMTLDRHDTADFDEIGDREGEPVS